MLDNNTKNLLFWTSPIILAVVVLVIYPMVTNVYLSFTNASLTDPKVIWVGLKNYATLFSSPPFLNAVVNSVVFASVSMILHMTIGVVAGVLLAKEIRGQHLFRMFVLVPYMIPTVVSVFLYKWLFDINHGLYSTILTRTGIWQNPIPVFGTVSTSMISVILVAFWQYMPFTAIMVLARTLTIPKTYYEIAEIDGLSDLQTFRHVTWPQLKGVVEMLMVLRFLWMLGMFDVIQLATGGGPMASTETLPLLAYRYAFSEYNMGLGSTVNTILLAVMLVGYLLYHRLSRRQNG